MFTQNGEEIVMRGGFHLAMRNLNRLCMFCGCAFLAVNLLGCGISQNGGKDSHKKEVAEKKEESKFDTEAAEQVVEKDWDDVGFKYAPEDISVSNIQQCGNGYLFVMKYLGSGACCNVFYVERQDGDWKILDRAEGNVDMTPGISISVARVNGKKVAWGSVGESIYVKKKDARKNVSFGQLCLISKTGKTCRIPIQNNQTYLQALELKDVKSWKALDGDGNPILDQSSCKKDYGDDVLEQESE